MNKVYVVGIGPGSVDQMTYRAYKTLQSCDVICGYSVYTDLIKEYFPDKHFITTPMKREIERCRMAVEEAVKGCAVSMVCSGDANVYGMGSLMYEVAAQYAGVEVEVVCGVTAALSGAAVLGAPLVHDFAVISLSDLLTPWELIEKRILCAAEADFCICFYNPSSVKRSDYLRRACELMLRYKKPETICGIVKNIAREGQQSALMTLDELKNTAVDMFTTVFAGNSATKIIDGKMVTPRGYTI